MMYQCPYCPKVFNTKSYLNGHITRMHSKLDKTNSVDIEIPIKPQQVHLATEQPVAPATLEIKVPPKKEKAERQGYHCLDCGFMLNEGENPCPNCGAHLDWSQV